jgi:hypothetical protein
MIRRSTCVALATAIAAALTVVSMAVGADPPEPTATYGKVTIPMTDAIAMELSCNVRDAGITCFDTETEALAALDSSARGTTAAAACTPDMQLYAGANFTGGGVNIVLQGGWVSLSTLGFDNITSSWKSGCVAGRLASGTGGAGTLSILGANSSLATLGAFDNTASSARRCPC